MNRAAGGPNLGSKIDLAPKFYPVLSSPLPLVEVLAEIAARLAVAGPILGKYSRADIAMKRGIRPVAHTRDKLVFEPIDVAIFDVARIVGLVADQTATADCAARGGQREHLLKDTRFPRGPCISVTTSVFPKLP
jgi:hypothetical protein